MLTTLTPAYSESFILECLDHGLTVKQAGVLLWRQRMNEAMERPVFAEAFNAELQKCSGDKPSILNQVDASLADKGTLGANVGHYATRGAEVGGGLSLLSVLPALFGKNKLKGLSKLAPALKRVVMGTGIGATAGAGYGAQKQIANNFDVNRKALNLRNLPSLSTPATQGEGVIDVYSKNGLRFGPQNAETYGAPGTGRSGPASQSDYVRLQQPGIDASDRRIADLENQKRTFRRTGDPAADYAQERTLQQQIAAEQKSRDTRQKDMNQGLSSLKTEQDIMNKAITEAMPGVREREQYFTDKGNAADEMRNRSWGLRKFVNWLGGTSEEDYDPVWKWKNDQSQAQGARQNMERSLQNPPIYRP